MSIAPECIADLLPQTQCQQCGYQGCTPYAIALSRGEAELNLCTPGGKIVINDLAKLLNLPAQEPADQRRVSLPKAIAFIDENQCIGCTACIKACPVDAILGATKQMHTILLNECTGCELCIAPCPVDCISMQPVNDAWLPRSHTLSDNQSNHRLASSIQAKIRFTHRTNRLERLRQQRKKQHNPSQKEQITTTIAVKNKAFNPADLISKAMARAESQQAQRCVPDNHHDFQQQQILKAQEQAAYRRAQRDFQYGNQEQKAIALKWLQNYKKQQEAE